MHSIGGPDLFKVERCKRIQIRGGFVFIGKFFSTKILPRLLELLSLLLISEAEIILPKIQKELQIKKFSSMYIGF